MNIRGWKYFFILSPIFLNSPTSFSQERHEFYNGVRQLGMGGAVVAVVNDETALLSNPAALGRLRDSYATLIDPEVEGNMNVERTLGYNFFNGLDPQFDLEKLRDHPGKRLHLKSQIFPSLIFPNFGIGLHGKYLVDAEVAQDGSLYEYNYLNDLSLVAGFNFRFFNGILKVGANARYTNRSEVKRNDLDPNSTDLKLSDLASEGVGFGSDVGVIVTAPIKLLPTLALVWRDVGDTSYNLQKGMFNSTAGRPDTVNNTLDVGLAVFPIHGNRIRSSWTVEVRDVLNRQISSDSMARRLHGGIELNFADALFFRAGTNQKYWTAGFEMAMLNSQLQLATYGEEIGTPVAPREDRRYVLKFALRF